MYHMLLPNPEYEHKGVYHTDGVLDRSSVLFRTQDEERFYCRGMEVRKTVSINRVLAKRWEEV